ncbi:nucleotidyltransferase family protein [Paenibacillus tritici]|uniref:Nucleotidyltransferase family protein n=1 Tax=Paenibacillus tritici TaxID=1873425 RepID=A0ABX2DV98_9BACL|nr:nucleotidyltransferase family protein [Paenibacillus tritici]NQX48305.1 nucleotidyltransferase family protein [Paenibacillus tritici]QUL55759.1 nucleotidyltransferase family protein [Paenibacillus tritici]
MTDRNTLNKASLSKEVHLILALLNSGNPDETARQNPQLFTGLNWDLFVELNRHHRVYPYLYPRLSRMEEKVVPSNVLEQLKWQYRRNTVQMLQLSGEMGNIANQLAGINIRCLFLKGPVLGHELYGDLSQRTSRDLDFLVPIEQLEDAETLLIGLGYEKEEKFESVLGDWKWREHHSTFIHPVSKINLELHWRLGPGPAKEPAFDELWKHSRTSSHFGQNVHYLGPEDLFMFLAVHGARHAWSRLRWLHDIKMLVQGQQPPDSARLTRLLQRYNHSAVGGQTLILATELLETQIAPGLSSLMDSPKASRLAQDVLFYLPRIVNLNTPPLEPEVEQHFNRYLPSILSPGNRMLRSASFFYPYAADAKTLPLPTMLHFLYFPLRPLLWSWRKVTGVDKEN